MFPSILLLHYYNFHTAFLSAAFIVRVLVLLCRRLGARGCHFQIINNWCRPNSAWIIHVSYRFIDQYFHLSCMIFSLQTKKVSAKQWVETFSELVSLGAVHKRRRNFFAVVDTPPPPCQILDPDLPNFYLLISCNIIISAFFPPKILRRLLWMAP